MPTVAEVCGYDVSSLGLEHALQSVRVHKSETADGTAISTLHFGEARKPSIILLPPSGVSALLLAPLAAALAQHFHIVMWEAPGCPDIHVPMREDDTTLARQGHYVAHVLERHRIRDFHFVGWCQGPQRVLHAIDCGEVPPPLSQVFIAPAGLGFAMAPSEFERCVIPIYREVSRGDAHYAEKVGRILATRYSMSGSRQPLAEELSGVHLANGQATLRFAKYMKSFAENRTEANALLQRVLPTVRTMLVHCRDDLITDVSESEQIARRHPAVDLRILDQGGHLLVFEQPAFVARLISRFIWGAETSAAVWDLA